MLRTFHYPQPFALENGGTLHDLTIAYHTYGDPGNPVIWVCHHLTANSDVQNWWPGLFDPSNYFIVCANVLGSCYGTTGATDEHFPLVTIRDMVAAHQLMRDHLQIDSIHLLVGGSMGGYQALEWAVTEPLRIQQLFLLATSAAETPWGIAIHEAQRLAIRAGRFGADGLQAARAIGMLTYRNYDCFQLTQAETKLGKLQDFRAASYVRYQGEKLVKRFNTYSYYALTRSMDSHHIGRGRQSASDALQRIQGRTLLIGIQSDILCHLAEQEFLASHIRNSKLVVIDSVYGHDGFIKEISKISPLLSSWL